MNICITGSTGRLGSVLATHFRDKGDNVVAFSQQPSAGRLGTYSLPDFLRREKTDIVLHLAWSTLPATSEAAGGQELATDLPLLEAILQASAEGAGPKPLLVFFSTCAVYGECKHGAPPFVEADPVNPKGFYARGKVAAEALISQHATDRGARALVLRVSNPYGFSQRTGYRQGVIPALVHAAFSGEEIELWGSGDQTKDYLHVDDFRGGVDVAVRSGLIGTFNVASGRSVALNEVVARTEQFSGRALRMKLTPARPWDVQRGVYSNVAFSEATGWQPSIVFEQGLERFVRAAQPQGNESIR